MHTPEITVCMTLRFLECLGTPPLLTIALTLIVLVRYRLHVVIEVEIIESRGLFFFNQNNLKSPLNINVSCLKHTSVPLKLLNVSPTA